MNRHKGLENSVCGLIRRWIPQAPLQDQRVPQWDRPATENRPAQRAILDIEYTNGNERRWIDVSVRHSGAGTAAEVHLAAKRPGEAARRGERAKHQRSEGDSLVAFVVETFGRVGLEAKHWLRRQTKELPEDIQINE